MFDWHHRLKTSTGPSDGNSSNITIQSVTVISEILVLILANQLALLTLTAIFNFQSAPRKLKLHQVVPPNEHRLLQSLVHISQDILDKRVEM